MEILTAIFSALIAAIVSLIVALISFIANRNTLRSEREKFDRELQRSMTTRLYDKRIEAYPEAIAITDGLRKSRLNSQEVLSQDYFKPILARLDEWHSTKAFLLLSKNAVQTFYALRKALREQPELAGRYSQEQIDRIWRSKDAFRSALRSDIQLLYEEEIERFRDD